MTCKKEPKTPIVVVSVCFERKNRTKIAKNRKKSHLVFVYLVDIQAIERKITKTHFPKNRNKNPRVNHHGKPEGKTIN